MSSTLTVGAHHGITSIQHLTDTLDRETTYDSFYSPYNHDFYDSFNYMDLDTEKHHIRLLRIHPLQHDEDDSTDIDCDLLDSIPLECMKQKFTTLSYCAGDPSKTQHITVNELRFNAFANLSHALRQARHFWRLHHEDKELLLWADQICINQSNPIERSHQVSFMGDIYAAAEKVLVCLSTEGNPTGGIKWLKRFSDFQEQHDDYDINHYLKLCWSDENLHRTWEAFIISIYTSAWFTRAWVRQEFIRSAQAIFLATFDSIALEPFVQLMHDYRSAAHFSEDGRRHLHDPSNLPPGHTGHCQVCYFAEHRRESQKIALNACRFLGLYPSIQTPNLLINLEDVPFCQSSDPRDLIYASLGFSNECYGLYPDYSPSVSYADVCARLACNFISRTDNLEILLHAYRRNYSWSSIDYDVPSWAPDWRKHPFDVVPIGNRIKPSKRIGKYAFLANDQGHENRVLAVRALLFLVLQTPTTSAPFKQWDSNNDDRRTTNWHFLTSDGSANLVGRAQKGDEVWILHGASRAYLFRRQDQYHELVGEMAWHLGRSSDDWQEYDHSTPAMEILLDRVDRMVEKNDPSIRTIKIR